VLEPQINQVRIGSRRGTLSPPGDLLIGFSGGLGSSVLLDLVNQTYLSERPRNTEEKGGREHPRKDRVWRKIRAAYVDVSDAFPDVSGNFLAIPIPKGWS
jgi:cytoplasmic tRNA 2-thiolation protein 2